MSKCKLGRKKLTKIEQFTGWKVHAAFVRGGWAHFCALVLFDGIEHIRADCGKVTTVNYKTGEIDWGEYDEANLPRLGTRI